MPLYEYECTQCHRRTEKRQKFSDPEITECPHCGGLLERVISAPAISFKGGGWYADGYGSKKPAPSSGSGESAGPSDSAAKSDSSAAPASSGSDAGGSGGAATSSSAAPASPTPAPASTPAKT